MHCYARTTLFEYMFGILGDGELIDVIVSSQRTEAQAARLPRWRTPKVPSRRSYPDSESPTPLRPVGSPHNPAPGSAHSMDRRIPRVTARPVPWTASFGVVMRRFPGCSQPAESADLDHSIPYAIGGYTSADNLKALCRKHHLLKTCCGWREVQEPDGIIVWKAPTDTFTAPACALLFANLTRSRTRAQDRKQRRRTERNCNRRTRLQCKDARLAYAEANPPPF